MKKFLPVTELARDDRFTWISEGDRFKDPRNGRAGNEERSTGNVQRAPKMTRTSKDAPDRSRSLMHGIFMGEVQALEAAGRHVIVIRPGALDQAAMGPDPMSAATAALAVAAGMEVAAA